jgi:hypothetical protein
MEVVMKLLYPDTWHHMVGTADYCSASQSNKSRNEWLCNKNIRLPLRASAFLNSSKCFANNDFLIRQKFNFYQVTRRHIPEDDHRCEIPNSNIFRYCQLLLKTYISTEIPLHLVKISNSLNSVYENVKKVEFVVLTAVTMDVTPCNLVDLYYQTTR